MFPLYSNLNTIDFPIAGRLVHFIQNWSLITNDPWVCQTVAGYRIEFTQTPDQVVLPPLLPFSEEESLAIHKAPLSDQDPGFVSSLFIVPKKGGGERPESPRPFCGIFPFQNGRVPHFARPFKKRRQYGQIGPHGRLPHSSSVDKSPEISEISLEGHNVGIYLSSLWPNQQCSPYQAVTS